MLASTIFVVIMGVFLPALSIQSRLRLKAGARFPPKSLLFRQTLIVQAFMLLMSLLTCKAIGLDRYVFSRRAISWRDAAAGAGTLLLFVACMYPIWKNNSIRKRDTIYKRLPQSSSEMPIWIVISLSAGIIEEIAYRGVLLDILWYWLGNWWIAVFFCALAFALGHAIQALRSTLIIFAMSIIFHLLVRFTGSLYVAMAVHAIYDAIAGFFYVRFYKLYPAQAVPPPTASLM